jgi:hypothetical protein
MFQQLINQQLYSKPSWFFIIYNSLQQWISKEIIDFDPFDYEVIAAQELIDQLQQTQSTKAELST